MKNKKGIGHILVIAAFGIIVVALSAGYYFAQQSPATVPEVETTDMPSEEWVTYTSEEYAYSFKYPAHFKIVHQGTNNQNIYVYNPKDNPPEPYLEQYFSVFIDDINVVRSYSSYDKKVTDIGSFTQLIKYTPKSTPSNGPLDKDIYQIRRPFDDRRVEFWVSRDEKKQELANKIYESFKFTDQTEMTYECLDLNNGKYYDKIKKECVY